MYISNFDEFVVITAPVLFPMADFELESMELSLKIATLSLPSESQII
jgi:hypothetical protein